MSGSVVQLTDATSAVIKNYDYDAFGNHIVQSYDDANPFRYSGEYFDDETDLYYLRARYYWPSLGQFTQQDPHWNPGNMVYGDSPTALSRGLVNSSSECYLPSPMAMMQSGNLYVYCAGNPISYGDSDGEAANIIIGAAISAFASGAIQIAQNLYYGKEWSAGVGKSILAGAAGGAIGFWKTPFIGKIFNKALGNAAGQLILETMKGGLGNVAGSAILGDISSFNDVLGAFGVGAMSTVVGSGAEHGLLEIADKMWSGLSRTAQKQAITGLGGVSQKHVNLVLSEIRTGTTENIYRQLIRTYGMDVVLAATISLVASESVG